MLEFQKIQFRNFLSYGNAWNEFVFSPGKITRIMGENGSGKSTCIVDTLYFALFGKTYRKQKQEQLVNWINKKDLEVKLFFKSRGKEYKIERGLFPDYFRIYQIDDGEEELIPVPSSIRSYQKILEEDILHMSESVFNQTVIKSMTKNISFMSLSKGEKRQVTEAICGIEVFTLINEKVHKDFIETRNNIELLSEQLNSLRTIIEQEKKNVESLRLIQEKLKSEKERQIKDVNEDIEENLNKQKKFLIAKEKIEKRKAIKKKLQKEQKNIQLEIDEEKHKYNEIETYLKFVKKKIEMFESTCSGCPKIKELKEDEDLDKKREEQELIKTKLKELKEQYNDIVSKIDKCNEIINNEVLVNNTLNEIEKTLKRLKTKKENIENEQEIVNIDETKLNKLRKQLTEKEKEYNEANKLKKHLQLLKTMMADDGIKIFIIEKYLPHINKILNTYLQKFGVDILFYFDTEFNGIIKTKGKEKANYFCFSEGQKRRIDLAILFTFLEFCSIKNKKSETNLIILDEISAGIDAYGENILYDILKQLAENNKEIITISHTGNIDPEKIDRVFNITTEKGFSKIEEIEC